MSLLQVGLASVYLLLGVTFFQNWYDAFKRDQPNLDEEDIFISRIVLGVATVLWPVVVPISYIKVLQATRREKRKEFQRISYN
ncbi:hypothetical protein H6G20_18385 [Desertifilum sp. FACHB-1129]|uniref:Uncharacterized protein n=1 Tax=Desertifilum tharense IPPAS B-1220 TaxID=1781255 RepID=A0A1E5QD28_9CYAN|nr:MULTISPECIES: hypothetical protein [Cyanophyceae]MDA0213709.1 hypothetical protein [Cyanobacteria bacterium FC1]MBD2313640.1 hypothetical protein [Desertifilum sp. FACHB-1129]MBD2320615.1 hypothetical protein [Desertifilum sp. FACHB-866]MBD2330743.1 hypothetical protein [Desertifilum sp. FACHB-868]MDL5052490.1 hypothetical protein [Oscillatoria laete-virens NRMC-F 0139]